MPSAGWDLEILQDLALRLNSTANHVKKMAIAVFMSLEGNYPA